jgi:hypothetical protein
MPALIRRSSAESEQVSRDATDARFKIRAFSTNDLALEPAGSAEAPQN